MKAAAAFAAKPRLLLLRKVRQNVDVQLSLPVVRFAALVTSEKSVGALLQERIIILE